MSGHKDDLRLLNAEIERLTRDLAESDQYNETARRVAAEQSANIERLTAENERLRAALEVCKDDTAMLTAENAQFRGCLEFIARPVTAYGGIATTSEARMRADAARNVLNQQLSVKDE